MEKRNDLSDTKLLIDFSSPVSKRAMHTPLIPIPSTANRMSVSPTNNNPFDVVAKQTISPRLNDPFECVFKNAYNNLNDSGQNSFNSEENQESSNHESFDSKYQQEEINVSPIRNAAPIKKVENSTDTHGRVTIDIGVVESPVQTCSVKNTTVPLQDPSSKMLFTPDRDSQSHVSGDFSTDEGLKEVIAKRVNKCIQKVLNNTLGTKFKSKDNLKTCERDTSIIKTYNKRSLSFVTLSNSPTKTDRLNKSYIECCSYSDPFVVDNEEVNILSKSIESYNNPESPASIEVSKNDDSVFLNPEKEVFEEANKLARTFSKIADSFSKNPGSDYEDDLLSCNPRWLYADSSEDEEEKLRNDPALNIRVSFTNSTIQTPSDSHALTAFKARQRRSLSHLQTSFTHDEKNIQRSNSVGSKMEIASVVPALVKSVPVALNNLQENPIRLKKKGTGDCKRGPMKAVMPVQRMTKEFLPYEDKVINNRETSPVRKQNPIPLIETPNISNSQLGIHPVASSTPNKSITIMPNLLTPAIQMPSNKRRSLGSTLESRKSRPSVADTGARQRSSSANSNNNSHLPTPIVRTKPYKGIPLVKSPMKIKSTSCLPRNTSLSTNNQVNPQSDNKSVKKSTKQTKSNFNPRALNDVKTKPVRPGRVKSAVNTISNLVTGKNKKVAVRDKENRVPV